MSIKAGVFALLLSFVLNGAGSCDGKRRAGVQQNSNQAGNANVPVSREPEAGAEKNDLKPLAQGQHSSVSNPFIFVARDAQSYEELRKLIKLPDLAQDFFQSNLVVAAFLGERRTGGYGVRITRAGVGSIRVDETSPGRGSMTIQVLTYPFSVVAVPVENHQALPIEAGAAWRAATRPYKVTNGEFTMSGGFAGRSEKFAVAGSVGVMREGNLATLFFDLQSKGGAKPRVLRDVASGSAQSDGSLTLAMLSPGSFVDQPADALRATGMFADNENRLSLNFDSIPGNVADGYNGAGTLNAEASAPPPQRKRPAVDAPQ